MKELAKAVKNEWRTNKEGLYQTLDHDVLARVLPTHYCLSRVQPDHFRMGDQEPRRPTAGPNFALVLDSPRAMLDAVDRVRQILEQGHNGWEDLRARLPGRLCQFAERTPDELGLKVSFHGYWHGDRDFIPGTSDWAIEAVCPDTEHVNDACKLLWERDLYWWTPVPGGLDRSLTQEERDTVHGRYCWTDNEFCTLVAAIDLALRADCIRDKLKDFEKRKVAKQDLIDWVDLMRLPFRHALFYRTAAFFCSLPTAIRRDPQGRAHATDGPAVEWADGGKSYCLHGRSTTAALPGGL